MPTRTAESSHDDCGAFLVRHVPTTRAPARQRPRHPRVDKVHQRLGDRRRYAYGFCTVAERSDGDPAKRRLEYAEASITIQSGRRCEYRSARVTVPSCLALMHLFDRHRVSHFTLESKTDGDALTAVRAQGAAAREASSELGRRDPTRQIRETKSCSYSTATRGVCCASYTLTSVYILTV